MNHLKNNLQNSEPVFIISNSKLSPEDLECKNCVVKFDSVCHFGIYEMSSVPDDGDKPADFETAIAATKFGKFNIIMLLIAFPAAMAAIFDTSAMSYVFPAAQCDLSLTLINKGTLNAMIYVGMITSAFLWGYLADSLGRKQILVYCFLLDCACNICCSFSQTFWMLLFFKFLSGFIVSGPFAVLMSYLSEFHAKNIRSRIILSTGISYSTGNIILPLLAWGIIPLNMDFKSKYFEYHSWNFFILVSAVPMLIAGLGHLALPESPKFLMTTGRNEEALEIFRKVYSMNTGKPKESYPIKILKEETKVEEEEPSTSSTGNQPTVRKVKLAKITAKRNKKTALKEGFAQIRPMCFRPYIGQVLLVFFMYFGLLLSMNTLRLWLPQIFTIMDQYHKMYPDDEDDTLCEMLEFSLRQHQINTTMEMEKCTVDPPNDQVYINSVIVAACSLVGYLVIGYLVDKIGKKTLMVIMLSIGGAAGLANYWSRSWVQTLAFSSIHVSLVGISCTTLVSAIVELFPTSLRTMTLSLALMFGRLGSIMGNLLFPVLLKMGCLPPYIFIGGIILFCALLTFALRSTVNTTFE